MRGSTIKALKKLWPDEELPLVLKLWRKMSPKDKATILTLREMALRCK